MDSTHAIARRAGILYFVFMIVAILGEFVLPNFLVPGDATGTAQKITASGFTYRVGLLTGIVTHLLFIFLIVTLYNLFQSVDKSLALLMLLLVSIGVAYSFANLLNKFVPLVLLSGSDTLAVFTQDELNALTHAFLRIHSSGALVSTVFWGLWLFPFGTLVIRSGFFPRILGILIMLAGVGYVITSVTSILWPDARRTVSMVMMPLYVGEIPIIFWLLIKGARVPRPQIEAA
mgnify:CR=1 FL=1